jgi:hypothetical protein
MLAWRVTQEYMMINWCLSMTESEKGCIKNLPLVTKHRPKLTLFWGTTPHLLLPDYFISTKYVLWMMLVWPKSIWWPISV